MHKFRSCYSGCNLQNFYFNYIPRSLEDSKLSRTTSPTRQRELREGLTLGTSALQTCYGALFSWKLPNIPEFNHSPLYQL